MHEYAVSTDSTTSAMQTDKYIVSGAGLFVIIFMIRTMAYILTKENIIKRKLMPGVPFCLDFVIAIRVKNKFMTVPTINHTAKAIAKFMLPSIRRSPVL